MQLSADVRTWPATVLGGVWIRHCSRLAEARSAGAIAVIRLPLFREQRPSERPLLRCREGYRPATSRLAVSCSEAAMRQELRTDGTLTIYHTPELSRSQGLRESADRFPKVRSGAQSS